MLGAVKAYGEVFNAANINKRLSALLQRLEAKGYPYDLVQIRFCVGDNAGPAVELSDLVKNWNATHNSPRARHRNDIRDDARV